MSIARADVWKDFLAFVSSVKNPATDIDVPGLLSTSWWHDFAKTGRMSSMWTQFMHYFVTNVRPELYFLYVSLPQARTLSAHYRAKGEHFPGQGFHPDFEKAKKVSLSSDNFPEHLVRYNWEALPENAVHGIKTTSIPRTGANGDKPNV